LSLGSRLCAWEPISPGAHVRILYLERGFCDHVLASDDVRIGRLWADFDHFCLGGVITVGYGRNSSCAMKQLDPRTDEIWEIRSRDPKPQIRVFGRFADTDVFVATHFCRREDLGDRNRLDLKATPGRKNSIAAGTFGTPCCKITQRTQGTQSVTTSPKTQWTSVSSLEDAPISPAMLAYFLSAAKNDARDKLLGKFEEVSASEGVTRAFIARRIRKSPEQVTRWLGAPGNWTLETLTNLAVAMGFRPRFEFDRLSELRQSNEHHPLAHTPSLEFSVPPPTETLLPSFRYSPELSSPPGPARSHTPET